MTENISVRQRASQPDIASRPTFFGSMYAAERNDCHPLLVLFPLGRFWPHKRIRFMDKKLLGVLGAASTLALLAGGPAAASTGSSEAPALQPAQSFGELLDPIPNATEILAAEEAKPAAETAPIQMAQFHHHHHHHHFYHHHHHHFYHHHHHHHHWMRRRWWHHHWMYY
jgi:hypothetical protein